MLGFWSTFSPLKIEHLGVIVGHYDHFIVDPQIFFGGRPSFIVDPQIFIGDSRFALETSRFHWRPYIFIEDRILRAPQNIMWDLKIFIGDPKHFIGDPRFSSETSRFSLKTPNFRKRPLDYQRRPPALHLGPRSYPRSYPRPYKIQWRPQIFFGDLHIFIREHWNFFGDPKIFSDEKFGS